ncbi:nucleotidyltransferase, putative [Ricinus communis]|uniref:Nucleotidyltransferase, putative n=1 Tax=Ricinus communis TaxID=3988 RepID=B9RD63_RICCO|nr:nucleotidyltransferase, putative [Ricinus communis]
MSKLKALTNSLVTQNQFVDSLTAHISLYHSKSLPLNPSPNPNPRSSILKWFSSLTVHQRQAHLTTVDFKFVQLVIQMLGKLRTQGHGRFIILPDLPVSDLPSLCYKKSRGLLSRDAESNESERLIFESIRLFGSREGEESTSCSIKCLDSLTVSEDLIGNVDKFVETMDRVSNGEFLRGEDSELGSDWVELDWLKAKGYYSIEAFVANRLEVALRLAWLNCGNGKKRGVKVKEKVNAAGAAANVFLRKKGCVDWWLNLDAETRRKFFTVVLGKAANSLDIVALILPGQHREYDVSKIFFSTLRSVSSISDCILRKLRGLVMVISLDCTKLELLGEGNMKHLTSKQKEKPNTGSRRKKAKTHNMKKPESAPDIVVNEAYINKPLKEHSQGLVLAKGRTAARKNRRGRNKNKNRNSSLNDPVDIRNSERSVAEAPCVPVISSDEAAMLGRASDDLAIQNVFSDDLVESANFTLNTSFCGCVTEPRKEGIDAKRVQGRVVGCNGGTCSINSECKQTSNVMIEDRTISSRAEGVNFKMEDKVISHVVQTPELDTVSSNEDIKFRNEETKGKSNFSYRTVRNINVKEGSTLIKNKILNEARSTNLSEYISYEWPSLAPVYFPSITSHLLPAADRLHLDVGRNWHSHIRQPFVPTVHQARTSPIESGYNRTLSRPLPMSLDWPPMVRSISGLAPSMTCNYDSGFISRLQTAFHPKEPMAEYESHCISEEEMEMHAVSGIDYNQYFGGGVMYWNPSDYPGTGFSRPPSLSSDDSTWAWHEDMNRAVDDMVAFSSSYSTNGLASPTAASFCSPFDPIGSGHQALGYVVPGNELTGKVLQSSSTVTDTAALEELTGSLANVSGDVEGKAGDSLPYPILPPIIIPNISREKSRSDFKRSHDHKSPCVPPSRRERPRIKRPPSPVVLCVPRAPHPPPPSPVSNSRKQRGFPTVRSGSSSPRHWSMRGWYERTNSEEAYMHMDGTEVVWPSWRNKNLSTHPMIQPLPGGLLQDHLIAMSQLARDQEHPDVSFPLQPPELHNCPARKASLSLMHSLLHDEIDFFCKKVAAENMDRKPFINWAVKRVTRSLQVLWPRSRTNVYGSNATGLSLPTSDVDLVVCLPPVRNLEPIKEAGILEGRNGIKETCLQHAARYLANQEWVKNDSLKTVENTAIPIIMLVVEVPSDLIISATSNIQSTKDEPTRMTAENENCVNSDIVISEESSSPKCLQVNHDSRKDVKSIRLDISFKSPSHTGLQTTELVKELTEQFPAATPLALVLKQFLADRSLDQSYSGGLSSYCLVLLITRFLQHEHHLGRPINQNWGSLLMDFLYFFGNVFDPRQMRISVQGSGIYINRERGYSIDPIHIDDPLFPTNNVGRNCFRIHQCIKAFSEAYSVLENELTSFPSEADACSRSPYRLLPKLIPSINSSAGF